MSTSKGYLLDFSKVENTDNTKYMVYKRWHQATHIPPRTRKVLQFSPSRYSDYCKEALIIPDKPAEIMEHGVKKQSHQ